MGNLMINIGIYLIMASVMFDKVTGSWPTVKKEKLTTIQNRITIDKDETRIQFHRFSTKVDSPSKSAKRFQARLRRSIEEEDVTISRIAWHIVEEEREAAFSLYSKSIQIDGTPVEAKIQTELVSRVVLKAYHQSTVSNILNFITLQLNDPDQTCLWLNSLFETMKMKNHLASIEGLHFEHVVKSAIEARLQVLNKNDHHQEDRLHRLVDTISNDLIEPTQRLIAEWAKSIQSGNDRLVISAAINYRVEFISIIPQLIPMAIGFNYLNSESNAHFAERCEKTIDFILRNPPSTIIDALYHLNQTLHNIEPHYIPMSERMVLTYTIKDLEVYVETSVEFQLTNQQILTELTNQIILRIRKIVWDPYVYIYKQYTTKGGIRKFMASQKSKIYSSNKKFTLFYESDTTNESSQWILEPINNADLFRIKNKESGEYLYADDVSLVWGYSNKRSVFTYKLNYGSDINNNSPDNRTVWVITPVFGNNRAVRFTIMNLHWKEYMDGHEARFNEVHTWKNKINPPKSARDWIISDGSDSQMNELKETRLVCFFDSSATQREGAGRFTIDNIDPSLYTHLIYSKARIDNVTFAMTIGNEKIDIIDKGYENIVALKYQNPKLKVMIALGGWGISEKYLRLHSDPENIQIFVESTLNFLQRYKFDGIHFELQFLRNQKDGITKLLMALNEAFKSRNYLLSATLSSLGYAITSGYDIPRLNEILDFISVMTFKYHGHWEEKVYHHAPLYHRTGDDVIQIFNADFAVRLLMWEGASLNKIVLGIPFFGMTWALETKNTKPMALASHSTVAGKGLKSKEKMAYYEICEAVRNEGWQVFQDPDGKMGPYAVSPPSPNKRTWVGYDDPAMAVIKANYILSKGLGGAYVWDVSQDDFRNTCGYGYNPMSTALANTLGVRASI